MDLLCQPLLPYLMFFSGIKLLFRGLGSIATDGDPPCTAGTQSIMSMAIVTLPALGILSTVVGILSVDHVSRETAKIIIFGPSGLGILGYLIATCFNVLAEYIHDRRKTAKKKK